MGTPITILMDANEHLDKAAAQLAEVGTKRNDDGSIPLPGGAIAMIGALPHGMQGGRPSVMIEAHVDGVGRVFVQTSMRNLLGAAAAFAAKWPELLSDPTVFAAKGDKAIVMTVPDGHVGVIGTVPADAVEKPDPTKSN